MKLHTVFCLLLSLLFYINCKQDQTEHGATCIIGEGQMPNMITDKTANLHVVYGKGDSIMYAESVDHGKSFSTPTLVPILPKLFSAAMRGPQIAFTEKGLT